MFTASLTVSVLAGLFTSGSIAGLPEWTDSYGRAIAQAGEKHKPVAVFLSPGDPNKLTKGKGLGVEVLKSLKSGYIPVRIDTTSEDGKKLADAFGVAEGVILSSRDGKQIALKYEGAITSERLSEYLEKYADQKETVTTEFASASTPVVQPQYYQPQYQPQYQQPRPVLNAIQNFGGMMMSPFAGGS
jgi:hypothetical protein